VKLTDFAVNHPAVISILLTVVLVFGIMTAGNLVQEMFPQIEKPSLLVVTLYPGASAEDVERDVSEPVERALSGLSGVSGIHSNSRESRSIITVEFDYSVDMNTKTSEVREELSNLYSDLPEEVDGIPTVVQMGSGRMPIYTVQVDSSWDPVRLTRYLEDQVVPRLSRINGVAEAAVGGAVYEEIQVQADPDRMAFYGLSILDLRQALNNGSGSVPAGTVRYRGSEMAVRAEGSYTGTEELEELVVGYADGSYIRLGDVARVFRTESDRDVYLRNQGRDAQTLNLRSLRGSDTLAIVGEARAFLEQQEESTGGQVQFQTLTDTGEDISLSMKGVQSSALFGGLLAVLILFLFLVNVRTTMVVAVSIPLSMLITFAAMYLGGQTLNLMSLGGLTVGIGMMVDNSIVVLENIYRHRSGGLPIREAALRGGREVGGAILASTTTSVCVFLPMLFLSGQAGETMRPIAFTIVIALSASLVVAVFVVPHLLVRFLRKESSDIRETGFLFRLRRAVTGATDRLSRRYRSLLDWCLEHTLLVVSAALLLLAASFLLLNSLGFQYIPSTDMNELNLYVETPVTYSLEETREKGDVIDRLIRQAVPEIQNGILYVGQDGALAVFQSSNKIYGRYRLVPADRRERSSGEIIRDLRKFLDSRVADARITVVNGGLDASVSISSGALSGVGQGFAIELTGTGLEALTESAETVRKLLESDPSVTQAVLGVNISAPGMTVQMDHRRAVDAGISVSTAAATLRAFLYGVEAGSLREGEEEVPVVLTSTLRETPVSSDILSRILLRSSGGEQVAMENFASLDYGTQVSEIDRENGLRSLTVTGIMNTQDLRPTQERMTAALEGMRFPGDVEWSIQGQSAQMSESFRSLTLVLLVAVFLVYVVMVLQFERFDQPFLVMGSVPFILIGVAGILTLTGTNLSIIAFLGIITLVGIVVNNAIVLIEYTNLLRQEGASSLKEAVLEGASTRLRPILMSSLTTILGVAPLAFRAGQGSEIYAPLGMAVFGGLITSSLITLVLIPLLYYRLEKSRERRQAGTLKEMIHE